MAYVKDMLNTEDENKEYNGAGIKKLVLRNNHPVTNEEIWALKNTKALRLEDMSNTDKEYNNRESWGELLLSAHDKPMTSVDVTTWSSLMRNALDIIKPQLNYVISRIGSEEFKDTFKLCVENLCKEFKLNSNCPMRLFKEAEEADLIKSVVYRSNKNHMIKILTDEQGIDWYLCAVYTGEVIIMLEALLDTICALGEFTSYKDNLYDFPQHTLVITYISREDIPEEVQEQIEEIDTEIQNLELSKDLMKLQQKVVHINTVTGKLYEEIEAIQKKYNLKTLEDFWNLAE